MTGFGRITVEPLQKEIYVIFSDGDVTFGLLYALVE
jgi:hypothetical protein